MAEEVSIKVNIADTVYPLKVTLEEEEDVRKAAKSINDKVQKFKEDFAVKDKQVLLSMVALEFATELVEFKKKKWIEDDGVTNRIHLLKDLLKTT